MKKTLLVLAVFYVVSWDQPEVVFAIKYDSSGHAVYLDYEGPPMSWQLKTKRAEVRAETLEQAEIAASMFGLDLRRLLNVRIKRVEETEVTK